MVNSSTTRAFFSSSARVENQSGPSGFRIGPLFLHQFNLALRQGCPGPEMPGRPLPEGSRSRSAKIEKRGLTFFCLPAILVNVPPRNTRLGGIAQLGARHMRLHTPRTVQNGSFPCLLGSRSRSAVWPITGRPVLWILSSPSARHGERLCRVVFFSPPSSPFSPCQTLFPIFEFPEILC